MLITNYLRELGFTPVSDDFYSKINMWLSWYCGKVASFHNYFQYNGKKTIPRSRATLGMAKQVCEHWANLLMNERVTLSLENDEAESVVNSVLESNNFHVRANRLIELSFALGSGAFVEYLSDGEVQLDYIRADMIFPLRWDNGKIIDCAFAGEKYLGGKKYTYINLHLLENGYYKILNRLIDEDGREAPLPDNLEETVYTKSRKPFFQIIMPNIINNIDLDNPMGISVFANAIDVLKGIDLVYDSYQNEFRLGKKRILVPAGMAQIQNLGGAMTPMFDDNDTEFYAMSDKSLTDLREINMSLRHEPHEKALQKNLDMLSSKCGLGGSERFRYSNYSVKTATEVISEKSELYQNIKKHELLLRNAVCDLAAAILHLKGLPPCGISVAFDDSIIEDTGTIAARAMAEFKEGIIDKEEYLKVVYG